MLVVVVAEPEFVKVFFDAIVDEFSESFA